MLAHSVFFSLSSNSPEAIQEAVDSCKKYLSDHPGIVFFACGTLNRVLNRPVNDRDFDVALHVMFDSKASHDMYQNSAEHQQFMIENKPKWRAVRVFDADVESK
jgi:hypothetical protein